MTQASPARAAACGLNHVTLAVTDIERSLRFYQDALGLRLRARWDEGAYLEAGSFWLCLMADPAAAQERRADYTHLAFDAAEADFPKIAQRLRACSTIWKENLSEGASLYFRDPDGHKLELHVGTLASRLDAMRAKPKPGQILFD